MAWYEGNMSTDAGALKNLFDQKLPLNSKWHIEDSNAGTNIGVYHNLDTANNVDYILVCKDNQTTYTTLELWEAWDSVNHVGVGDSLTTIPGSSYTIRLLKGTNYGLSVKDHRIVFCDSTGGAVYIGQLKRIDTTKNMPCLIAYSSSSQTYNPLGHLHAASYTCWALLYEHLGNVGVVINPFGEGSAARFVRTINNDVMIFETPVHIDSTERVCGWLDGVMQLYTTSQGFVEGDLVYVGDIAWLLKSKGSSQCLVRKT